MIFYQKQLPTVTHTTPPTFFRPFPSTARLLHRSLEKPIRPPLERSREAGAVWGGGGALWLKLPRFLLQPCVRSSTFSSLNVRTPTAGCVCVCVCVFANLSTPPHPQQSLPCFGQHSEPHSNSQHSNTTQNLPVIVVVVWFIIRNEFKIHFLSPPPLCKAFNRLERGLVL